jgi:hypothetical protein
MEQVQLTKVQLPTFDTSDFDLDELTRQTIETTQTQEDSDDGENSIHMSPIEAEKAKESFIHYDPELDHIRRVKKLTLCLDKVKESLQDITDTPVDSSMTSYSDKNDNSSNDSHEKNE